MSGDHILWNQRGEDGTGGDIDEIVMQDVATVHIEQMHARDWWIALYKDDDRFWMGHFTCDSKGRMTFHQADSAGVEWTEDESHEERS